MNDHGGADSVTLRSSPGGIWLTVLSLVGFDAVATAVLVLNGFNAVTVGIAALALMSTIVIVVDVPISTTFDEAGVQRVTPGRRHRIEWEEIDRLVRMRRGGIRLPGSAKHRGIVALRGRKRTVLVDHTESADDHQLLWSVLCGQLDAERFDSLRLSDPTEGTEGDHFRR